MNHDDLIALERIIHKIRGTGITLTVRALGHGADSWRLINHDGQLYISRDGKPVMLDADTVTGLWHLLRDVTEWRVALRRYTDPFADRRASRTYQALV